MTFVAAFTLPLEVPEQKNPPPRPKERDEKVIIECAKSVLENVVQWMQSTVTDQEKEEILEEITEVLKYELHDSYRIVKQLDQKFGWDADRGLIDIFDDLSSYSILQKEVKQWVEVNGIKLKFSIGDNVQTPDGPGKVVSLKNETAEYLIQTDSFLQKYPQHRGSSGVLYHAEKVSQNS